MSAGRTPLGTEPPRAEGRMPPDAPARFGRPSPFAFVVGLVFVSFFLHGVLVSDLSPDRLARGVPALVDFLFRAVPPDPGRLPNVIAATVETFEMALIGTALGAAISLPVSLLAARNTSPHPAVYYAARGVISFLRSVPDLVWGLVFVIAVGLGPVAGICAITVDAVGFCGRFFAERVEELDAGPVKALRATGASPYGVIAGAIVPAAFPSFVATVLFALEGATRSAVVLGLVGAGGIGVELATSMQTFQYQQALTVILIIFVVVLVVERTSAAIRRRMI